MCLNERSDLLLTKELSSCTITGLELVEESDLFVLDVGTVVCGIRSNTLSRQEAEKYQTTEEATKPLLKMEQLRLNSCPR